MKKILLLMFLCTISICAKAQEADSLQTKTNISIEELAAKLDKLQHDYDLLQLRYTIDFTTQGLERIERQSNNCSTKMMVMFHHPNEYEFGLNQYLSYLELYKQNTKLLNQLEKETMPMLNNMIKIEITKSRFSKDEIGLLQSLNDYCINCCERAKSSLIIFKVYIDVYKRNIQ
ncbi:MAG: hypothetical protein J6Q31_03985 [Alistipes sp.]|nr:hypothetical protein [Alistipes sp.]